MGVPQIQFPREQLWWWPIPEPGDPAPPYLRDWLRERINLEDQAVLVRAELVLQKATLAAKLEYLNQVEAVAGKYMK